MKHLKAFLFAAVASLAASAFAESTADYVQENLVAMWDGYENAGVGVHDLTSTTWKNLAASDTEGTYDLTLEAGGTWDTCFLQVNSSGTKRNGRSSWRSSAADFRSS